MELAKTVMEVADVAWTAIESCHHHLHHEVSPETKGTGDVDIETLRSENERLRQLLEKNLSLLEEMSIFSSLLHDCPADLHERLLDAVNSEGFLSELDFLHKNFTSTFPFNEPSGKDLEKVEVLIKVDHEEPSWWVWLSEDMIPRNKEEKNGIDNENYVIVTEEQLVDGVANFMARCILANPKSLNLTPAQLQKALMEALRGMDKVEKMINIWHAGMLFYTLATWSLALAGWRMDITMRNKKNMKQDFFKHLPPEIIIEILSKLPPQAILSCKCVCKSWHDLLETNEFVKFHLSTSIPGLALTMAMPDAVDTIIELTDVLDIQHHDLDDLRFDSIVKFNFPHRSWIHGSVDGLLLLQIDDRKLALHLYNPITRQYIDLSHSHSRHFEKVGITIYGFGVSKISGLYKAVGIFAQRPKYAESECMVYTIGTGSWRSIAPDDKVCYVRSSPGALVNGNLHWLACDLNGTLWVSCFDLETELFTTFSLPSHLRNGMANVILFAVEGSLCLTDYHSNPNSVTVWLIKKYEVEKSWTKVFVIPVDPIPIKDPVRVSKDGVIFLEYNSNSLLYYSSQDKSTRRICDSGKSVYLSSLSFTPSFLSLKCFKEENSISF